MSDVLEELTAIIAERRNADPDKSYVAQLNRDGLDRILAKVEEESAEAITAAKGGDREELVRETADLWFHTLVMLQHLDTSVAEVLAELERRLGVSGLEEKAGRGKAAGGKEARD